jgi:hypothetical protein
MTTCISGYYPGSYPEFLIYPGNTSIKIGHVDFESVHNKSDFNLVSKCEDKNSIQLEKCKCKIYFKPMCNCNLKLENAIWLQSDS